MNIQFDTREIKKNPVNPLCHVPVPIYTNMAVARSSATTALMLNGMCFKGFGIVVIVDIGVTIKKCCRVDRECQQETQYDDEYHRVVGRLSTTTKAYRGKMSTLCSCTSTMYIK